MREIKGLMLLADEFEDIEALGTLDLVRRANIICDTVSITNNKMVTSQSKVKIEADYLISEVNLDNYEFVILPGGAAVMKTHLKSDLTASIVKGFVQNGKLVAAICAAPSVLGKEGYLKDLDYTCFPSFDKLVVDGHYEENKIVVHRNNIITSKACGTTFEFAYEIIKALRSEAVAKHIMAGTFYDVRSF